MEKGMRALAQAKEDGETVHNYIRDLNSWENEMKQKEAALKDEQAQQVLPPVRTRQRRDKYKKKNNRKRPAATDQPWEVFDPNKPYEEMEDVGPLSLTLDYKQSEIIKQMKVKEEAQYQKERGNRFVKVERWDDAIACYNRAIQLVKDNAIYYANRGLCYLKKESLHQAEQDCTEALRLDPTYVKALQRRATARERLGSLRAASADLSEVIKLEPHNVAAHRQLESIKQRMGTKGRKAKSSPVVKTSTPPTTDLATKLGNSQIPKQNSPGLQAKEGQDVPQSPSWYKTDHETPQVPPGKILGVPQASQIPLDIQPTPIKKVEVNDGSSLANWKEGLGENVLVIKPVKKPPHLRSKRALKTIAIREIPLGKTVEELDEPVTRMKIIEIDQSQGDRNNNEESQTDESKSVKKTKETIEQSSNGDIINDVQNNGVKKDNLIENIKIESGVLKTPKGDTVAPTNSVQFMAEWRNLRGDDSARCDYLSLLEPSNIAKVFANALESSVLSEIIQVLYNFKTKLRPRVTDYLKGLSRVKRLSALVMFLSANDKELLNKLLVHCKTAEDCSDEDITDLKNKYEL